MTKAHIECSRNGHRFEPRYDRTPSNEVDIAKIQALCDVAMPSTSMVVASVYVCDICVRCGMVVKRKNEDSDG